MTIKYNQLMKFKLPRSNIGQELIIFITQELRRLKKVVPKVTKNNLEEMATICRAIEETGLPSYLALKKLPRDLGYGIFLRPDAKPILKGQMIAPYSGKFYLAPQFEPDDSDYAFAPLSQIRLSKEDHEIFGGDRPWHPRRYYEILVDAAKMGNFTRFINHSAKPNVIADEFAVPSNSYGLTPAPIEIVYMARKTIHPGEQLLVCYEGEADSYWGVVGIKPLPIVPRTFRLDASMKVIGECP